MPGVNNSMHLFDAMLKPIINYGAEIWSVLNLNSKSSNTPIVLNEQQTFFKSLRTEFPIISKFMNIQNPAENLHIKFSKRILGFREKNCKQRYLFRAWKIPNIYTSNYTKC